MTQVFASGLVRFRQSRLGTSHFASERQPSTSRRPMTLPVVPSCASRQVNGVHSTVCVKCICTAKYSSPAILVKRTPRGIKRGGERGDILRLISAKRTKWHPSFYQTACRALGPPSGECHRAPEALPVLISLVPPRLSHKFLLTAQLRIRYLPSQSRPAMATRLLYL